MESRSISEKRTDLTEASEPKKYHAVIFLDSDGPINDLVKGMDLFTKLGKPFCPRTLFYVSNKNHLKAVLQFLDANHVLIVPGSQRITYTDENLKKLLALQTKVKEEDVTEETLSELERIICKKAFKQTPSKDDMLSHIQDDITGEQQSITQKISTFEGYNKAFNDKNGSRNFLLEAHANILIERFKGFHIDPSKVPLLDNIKNIPGAEYITPSKIYHVDDNEKYAKTTTQGGYNFIYVKRTAEELGYFSFHDNQYLAHMLNIAILPDQSISWFEAMEKIDAANIEQYTDVIVANDLKALMKVNFAILSIVKAKVDLKEPLQIDEIIEYFFLLNQQISETNPFLLFDYLNFFTRPDLVACNQFDESIKLEPIKDVSIIALGEHATKKSIAKKMDTHLVYGLQQKNFLDTSFDALSLNDPQFIKHITLTLKDNENLDEKQSKVFKKIQNKIIKTEDIEQLITFGKTLLAGKENAFKFLFKKKGFELFSHKNTSSASVKIIALLKDKIVDLAIRQGDPTTLQNLIIPAPDGHIFLHYHQDKAFNKSKKQELTGHEKRIIKHMVEYNIDVPKAASLATQAYYHHKRSQHCLKLLSQQPTKANPSLR